MKTIESGGKIEKGELIIFNEEVFYQAIQDIGFVSHVHLTLEYGNKRTLDQNSYLWGAVVEAIRVRLYQEGYDFSASECYKYLENRFCKIEKLNHKTDRTYSTVIPFKELSTEQFEEIVIEDIRQWAQQSLDTYIKLPHEYYQLTLDAYDQWKRGEITLKKAQKLSQS